MSKIKIANPKPGCTRYTTESQAERYVRRGEAVQIGNELHFLSETEQKRLRNIERHIQQSERCGSDVYIRDTVWWDGADPGGMHRPGELVS